MKGPTDRDLFQHKFSNEKPGPLNQAIVWTEDSQNYYVEEKISDTEHSAIPFT